MSNDILFVVGTLSTPHIAEYKHKHIRWMHSPDTMQTVQNILPKELVRWNEVFSIIMVVNGEIVS